MVAPSAAVADLEWLVRHTPDEWIASALAELSRAEQAFARRDHLAGVAGARRAAGMALNAALVVRPRAAWGRTYLEHLVALQDEPRVPEVVRTAARWLVEAQPASTGLLALRTRAGDDRLLEAARTVMAHAYAVVHGTATREAT